MELTDVQKQIILDLLNQVPLGNLADDIVMEVIDLRKKISLEYGFKKHN